MIFIKNLTLLIIFWEQSISILENFTVHISSLLIDEIKMKPNDIDFKSQTRAHHCKTSACLCKVNEKDIMFNISSAFSSSRLQTTAPTFFLQASSAKSLPSNRSPFSATNTFCEFSSKFSVISLVSVVRACNILLFSEPLTYKNTAVNGCAFRCLSQLIQYRLPACQKSSS